MDVEFNDQERAILRQATSLRELAENKQWSVFQKLLQAHIEARQRLLNAPISSLPTEFRQLDAVSKMVELECIKGAIIGLQLALNLPSLTIGQAQQIIREAAPQEETPQPEGDLK